MRKTNFFILSGLLLATAAMANMPLNNENSEEAALKHSFEPTKTAVEDLEIKQEQAKTQRQEQLREWKKNKKFKPLSLEYTIQKPLDRFYFLENWSRNFTDVDAPLLAKRMRLYRILHLFQNTDWGKEKAELLKQTREKLRIQLAFTAALFQSLALRDETEELRDKEQTSEILPWEARLRLKNIDSGKSQLNVVLGFSSLVSTILLWKAAPEQIPATVAEVGAFLSTMFGTRFYVGHVKKELLREFLGPEAQKELRLRYNEAEKSIDQLKDVIESELQAWESFEKLPETNQEYFDFFRKAAFEVQAHGDCIIPLTANIEIKP